MTKVINFLLLTSLLISNSAFALNADQAPRRAAVAIENDDPGQDDPSVNNCVNLGTHCEDLDADSTGDTAQVCCDIIYCRFAAAAVDCGVHYTGSDQ